MPSTGTLNEAIMARAGLRRSNFRMVSDVISLGDVNRSHYPTLATGGKLPISYFEEKIHGTCTA